MQAALGIPVKSQTLSPLQGTRLAFGEGEALSLLLALTALGWGGGGVGGWGGRVSAPSVLTLLPGVTGGILVPT